MVSGILQSPAPQPKGLVRDICLFPEYIRIQKRGGTGKVICLEPYTCTQQFGQSSRPFSGKTRLDISHDTLRRQLSAAGQLTQIRQRLFLGLLGRTAEREKHKAHGKAHTKIQVLKKHLSAILQGDLMR